MKSRPVSILSLAVLLLSWPARTADSHSFEVTAGATSNQVFQRDAHGKARIAVRGRCELNGCRSVEAQAAGGHTPVLPWKTIATVASGEWAGEIDGVPTGGPYRVEFRAHLASGEVSSEVAMDGILVGDLWILAGQSNMDGRGELSEAEEPDERVHNFDFTYHWSVAKEPIADRLEAVDPAEWIMRDTQNQRRPYTPAEAANTRATRFKAASLATTFAKELVARTGVPIGLVPCSRGGASMEDWSPSARAQGTVSLYGAMLRRYAAVGGRVTGMLWYQGEHEGIDKTAPTYAARFRAFIEATRSDFDRPDLPVYYVQLARLVRPGPTEWNVVQLAQLELEHQIPHFRMSPAVDLDLVDEIHVNSAGLKRLGRRMANLACADLFPERCAGLNPGPRPTGIRVEGTDHDRLVLTFSGVNGRLMALGRVGGFSIRDRTGADLFAVYSAAIDPKQPNSIIVRVNGKSMAQNAVLWYGWGTDPHCNVNDEKDMAVPVFVMPIPTP